MALDYSIRTFYLSLVCSSQSLDLQVEQAGATLPFYGGMRSQHLQALSWEEKKSNRAQGFQL